MSTTLVKTSGLKKSFKVGDGLVEVLHGIDIEIKTGEFVILFGPSGCGKSTMLHTLLGLEPPSEGKIMIEGKDFYALSEDERADYRKRKISTIFQQPLWIKALNVVENVAFPLRLLGKGEEEAKAAALKILKEVGMDDWANYMPTELSAGQQQKVSLSRSLMIEPIFVAADEPTGNLDTVSGENLMETFADLSRSGKTICMITHDLEYLKYATKLFHMVDGKIVEVLDRGKISKLKIHGKKNGATTGNLTVRDVDFLKKTMGKKDKSTLKPTPNPSLEEGRGVKSNSPIFQGEKKRGVS